MCTLDSKSNIANMSCKKGLSAKQAAYVYSKYKNEEAGGDEQVYESKINNKETSDSHLYSYECAMLNNSKLYNVYTCLFSVWN